MKDGQTPLRKKGEYHYLSEFRKHNSLYFEGRGRLIHVSDFINPESGRLVVYGQGGEIVRDARKIIFPGANGDPWWDSAQMLQQMDSAISIFEEAFPGKQGLFVFDNSSGHQSLGSDALKAFEMNMSDGGKQRLQKDTVIPDTNPTASLRGKPQKMTKDNGEAKGLKSVLEERGFDVRKLKAKCKPVCPVENSNCCMARLLSQQDDFKNQISMLEVLVKARGHEIIFLPKFHCELNPIEMVSIIFLIINQLT